MSSYQREDFTAVVPYVTNSYADGYMASYPGRDAWASSTETLKTQVLRAATMDLDKLHFVGHRLDVDQTREWPRFRDMDTYGDVFYLDDNGIPDRVAWATCEQAWFILKNYLTGIDPDDRMDAQDQGLQSVNRSGASENFDLSLSRRRKLCKAAYDWVRDYIAKTASLGEDWS